MNDVVRWIIEFSQHLRRCCCSFSLMGWYVAQHASTCLCLLQISGGLLFALIGVLVVLWFFSLYSQFVVVDVVFLQSSNNVYDVRACVPALTPHIVSHILPHSLFAGCTPLYACHIIEKSLYNEHESMLSTLDEHMFYLD